jgi:hypothetical protein
MNRASDTAVSHGSVDRVKGMPGDYMRCVILASNSKLRDTTYGRCLAESWACMTSYPSYPSGLVAGFCGAVAMSALGWLLRTAGAELVSVELLLGSLITGEISRTSLFIGYAWHLLNGALFGLVYVFGFRTLQNCGWLVGLTFGAVHWIFAGIGLAFLPAFHPLIPEIIPEAGIFAVGWGAPAFTLLIAQHLLFGTLVGGICQAWARLRVPVSGDRSEKRAA